MITPVICAFESSKYLLFSSNVPPLVYYSHIPIIIISLILGFFVLFKNRKELSNKILFSLTLAFSAWVFFDSVFWASNRSNVIMFVWSLQILFEPIVYISALYLLYVLIRKRDISFSKKILIGLIYLPIIILVPTRFSLSAFNIATCLSEESSIIIYSSYGMEILFTLWIILFSIKEFIKAKSREVRHQIAVLTTGIILLLLAFSSGNIISSFTEDWQFAQIGLFAMPIFIGFLAYSVVKFQTFNIKLIGANVLVAGLWVLTGSLLFLNNLGVMRIVIIITLFITVIFGILLIKSVRKEVRQRELIEKQEKELEVANQQLSEFMSFASHEIRTPATLIKGMSADALEGDMGTLEPHVKDAMQKVYIKSNDLIDLVGSYLDKSKIELNQLNYNFSPFDMKDMVKEIVQEFQPNADQENLTLKNLTNMEDAYNLQADKGKIKEVLRNLIGNAIKYNIPNGSVSVSTTKNGENILINISDTGVGIPQEIIPQLFKKFSRADAKKINLLGSGLGLFLAKTFIDAHHGKIWAESAGENKGSTFFVELPIVQK